MGVTCFSVDPVHGLTALGGIRSIPQPGNEALILGGDIVFSPSQTALFHTFNNKTVDSDPGYLFAYPVVDGQVGQTAVVTVFDNIADPFTLNFLDGDDTRLFMSNAVPSGPDAPGAVLLEVSYPSLEVSIATPVNNISTKAACWVAYAPNYDVLYVDDAGDPNISVVNATDISLIGKLSFETPSFGSADTLVEGDFLYTLTIPFTADKTMLIASPQILVWNLSPVKVGEHPAQIQSFDIFEEVGTVRFPFGMAIWPAKYPGTGQS